MLTRTSHAGDKMSSSQISQAFKNSVFVAGVCAVLIPLNAVAQEKKPEGKEDDKVIVLEPISIDAKADVITGGVQLNSDDLDRIDPVDIKDVFRQEPGVTVGSPLSISQKVYVNGIEDTNLSVDVDGARQANKTYHHEGTTIVDPGLLKAVKIETGVAPADAGPQALAGTITLETKDGRDFVAPGENFGGFAKLSYNSNTEGFSEDLALAIRHAGFDALVYGTHAGGNSYTDGNGTEVLGTAPKVENGLLKVGFTGASGYRLKVSATRYDDIGYRPARTNFALPANGGGNTGFSNNDYSRQSVTASFGDETPTDLFDPKISISQTKTHLDTYQYANSRSIIARVESINGKASNTITTDMGKITAGADFYVDEGTGGVTSVSTTDRREKVSNYGLFSQARLSHTENLRTSFGGRLDHNRFVGNNDEHLNNTGLSGNANIEYDITSEVMGYAGVGTVFGGIPMTEVGVQTSDRTYNGVKPSRSYNMKIGGVYEMGGLSFDGNVFKTRIKNSHDLTTSDRSTNYDVTSEGVNLSAKYDYGLGFVRGGYSKSTVRIDSAVPVSGGNEYYHGILTGDMFSLEAAHTFPEYGVRVGTTNELVLENDDTLETRGFALNGYFVANLYAEWSPEQVEGLLLRADVKNLFDRTYADRANGGSYSTTSTVSAFNDPGRTFLVTAKYDF